jgi:hypothetical protein
MRIRVVPVATRCTEEFTSNLPQPAFQLAAVVRRILAHGSGGQDEFVAKCRRNWTASFQQRFQMGFGGLLKAEQRFAPVAAVCMAARQEIGLGNPNAIFVLSELHLGEWNNHCE